ncbi:hypothetical protein [Pseudogulbenkiania ferrooxidans]|nr:hypothetical protein [Pseudogulbenkiania ferrooxidans]
MAEAFLSVSGSEGLSQYGQLSRLRAMRYFFLLLSLLLVGCDASQVNSMAHSPEAKQLAQLGQALLGPSGPARSSVEQAPAGVVTHLVNGKSAVGHRNFNDRGNPNKNSPLHCYKGL